MTITRIVYLSATSRNTAAKIPAPRTHYNHPLVSSRLRRLACARSATTLIILVILVLASTARAQTDSPRLATLAGWQQELDIALLDQRHGYGGLHYDRGVFRRYTWPIDHEYPIDLATYRFSPADDAGWHAAHYGFRSYNGSINTSRFATRSHFRVVHPLPARHTVYLDGFLREDRTAERALTRVGYAYRLGNVHRLGAKQTIATYKPDLDFSLFYQYGGAATPTVQFEFTLLDIANNFIFDQLGVEPVQEDTARSYQERPVMLAGRAVSPVYHGWRGEIAGGWMRAASAKVRSTRKVDRRYTWSQGARYVGLLLERPSRHATAGLLYRHTFSSAERTAPAGSAFTSDYSSRQRTHAGTAYLLGRWRQWQGDLWLTLERFVDRQYGTDYDLARLASDLNFRETRLSARVEVAHVPKYAGLRYGLTFLHLGHSNREDAETFASTVRHRLTDHDERLVLHVGYQLRPGSYLLLGGAYDVDGDGFYADAPRRYDGGYARISVTW